MGNPLSLCLCGREEGIPEGGSRGEEGRVTLPGSGPRPTSTIPVLSATPQMTPKQHAQQPPYCVQAALEQGTLRPRLEATQESGIRRWFLHRASP